ncbi:uncharacterized protein CCOS01_09227 [Colletotrichum costaricense]|uniref:Uncharacterized protein n=1 Tax=Colletotrichum costaricense TaxID=1209916 RepID=A0AAI9YTY0_9PEZI|nr:uncharacterized protein CCOS01_09227 [Colletotrichum costaricense]KAK1524140.1 hypothetical protein CCOS01_09227 [Colletotrichum costaricense]
MDAAIDLNNMNAANTTDVLSQHVQEEGHGGPTRPFELIARTDWMRLMYHTTSQRGPTPPSREYLLPRVDNIDEFMEWRESFVQRTIYFDNWFLQFIYSIFDFFRLQYRILVTHWSEYSRWEKERIKNPWGNWEGQIGFQDDSPDPKWRAKLVVEVKDINGMDMGLTIDTSVGSAHNRPTSTPSTDHPPVFSPAQPPSSSTSVGAPVLIIHVHRPASLRDTLRQWLRPFLAFLPPFVSVVVYRQLLD